MKKRSQLLTKSGKSRRRSRRSQSSGRRIVKNSEFTHEEERWDAFTETLKAGVFERSQRTGQVPFDKPRSYLKREVYRYVCDCLDNGRDAALEDIISVARSERLPKKPTFRTNPFHWALLGLQRMEGLTLGNADVSRFGRQLLHARRHNVPPQFLVGFIYQSGSPGEISTKVDKNKFEDWFPERGSVRGSR